jgi:Zn-dependent peptidase ImmA (M78 family)
MDAMGLASTFKIKVANVPNVEATIKHHERYILYNPGFITQVNEATKNKWASIFILAHEVGHHLDGHTEAGLRSCPAIELDADQFAGFVLCKMGATLQESQLAMYYISNMASSKTHPGRLDRLAAIEKGWDKAEMQKESAIANTVVPGDSALTN